MVIGLGAATAVAIVLLMALANQGNPGHYRVGRWELMKVWRVHRFDSETVGVIHGFGPDRKKAVAWVRHYKTQDMWTELCYLSWQWELVNNYSLVWRGKKHARRMNASKKRR